MRKKTTASAHVDWYETHAWTFKWNFLPTEICHKTIARYTFAWFKLEHESHASFDRVGVCDVCEPLRLKCSLSISATQPNRSIIGTRARQWNEWNDTMDGTTAAMNGVCCPTKTAVAMTVATYRMAGMSCGSHRTTNNHWNNGNHHASMHTCAAGQWIACVNGRRPAANRQSTANWNRFRITVASSTIVFVFSFPSVGKCYDS